MAVSRSLASRFDGMRLKFLAQETPSATVVAALRDELGRTCFPAFETLNGLGIRSSYISDIAMLSTIPASRQTPHGPVVGAYCIMDEDLNADRILVFSLETARLGVVRPLHLDVWTCGNEGRIVRAGADAGRPGPSKWYPTEFDGWKPLSPEYLRSIRLDPDVAATIAEVIVDIAAEAQVLSEIATMSY